MYIGWFSCGVTSAVACRLAVDQYGKENVRLFYMEIEFAHIIDDNVQPIMDGLKSIGQLKLF
jgi:hypothetical protein